MSGEQSNVLFAVVIATLLVGATVTGGITIGELTDIHDSSGEVTGSYGQNVNQEAIEASFAHNESGLGDDYEPDEAIPENQFRIFYSDSSDAAVDIDDGNTSVDNIDLDDLNTTGGVGPDEGLPASDVQNYTPSNTTLTVESGTTDRVYLLTPQGEEIAGWTLGQYRHNQLINYNQSIAHSHYFDNQYVRVQDDAIKHAYTDIVGVHGGSIPQFMFPEEYERTVGSEGQLLVYTDFLTDYSELPDDRRHLAIDDTVAVPDPSGSVYYTEPNKQFQEADTYHIESGEINTSAYADGDQTNYSLGSEEQELLDAEIKNESYLGVKDARLDESAAKMFNYNDTVNEEIEFSSLAEVSINKSNYDWRRERLKVYDDRSTVVTATTSTSATASCTGTAGENSTSISCSCSTTATENDIDTTESRDWTELNGDREINITRTKTVSTVTGTISGTCSGSAGSEGGTATVSSTISGDISSDATKTFHYEYWNWWNPADQTDRGGWNFQNKTIYDSDQITNLDEMKTAVTDNNDVNITQVAVEIDDNRYHSIIDIDHEQSPETVTRNNMDEMYYWSMLMYGEDTFVTSEWKSFSATRYSRSNSDLEKANSYNTNEFETTNWENESTARYDTTTPSNTKGTSTTTVPRPIPEDSAPMPRQLGVFTFPESDGPKLRGATYGDQRDLPRLVGWRAYNESSAIVSGDSSLEYCGSSMRGWQSTDVDRPLCVTGNNIDVNASDPLFYDKFVVENAPSRATRLVSIHGDTTRIKDSDTVMMDSAEPDVDISFDKDRPQPKATVEVTDPNTGDPLQGRTLQVATRTDVGSGEYTTNAAGETTFNVSNSINYMQVYVEGDELEKLVNNVNNVSSTTFYTEVTATKADNTNPEDDIFTRGFALIKQLLFVSPLLLLYLLWRDGRLGV